MSEYVHNSTSRFPSFEGELQEEQPPREWDISLAAEALGADSFTEVDSETGGVTHTLILMGNIMVDENGHYAAPSLDLKPDLGEIIRWDGTVDDPGTGYSGIERFMVDINEGLVGFAFSDDFYTKAITIDKKAKVKEYQIPRVTLAMDDEATEKAREFVRRRYMPITDSD